MREFICFENTIAYSQPFLLTLVWSQTGVFIYAILLLKRRKLSLITLPTSIAYLTSFPVQSLTFQQTPFTENVWLLNVLLNNPINLIHPIVIVAVWAVIATLGYTILCGGFPKETYDVRRLMLDLRLTLLYGLKLGLAALLTGAL